MAKQIATLARSIKADKYKKGITAESIVRNSTAITAMSEVITMLKNLEDGLKPASYSALWILQKKQWLIAVNELN